MKKLLLGLINWTWCFPQMLLGLLVKIFTKAKKQGEYYAWNECGSMSLGTYIFLAKAHQGDEETLKHEKGHTKQSYILGWFYLLVIGLPSLIWSNCFWKYRRKHNISYYAFYTESWANKLMSIEKNEKGEIS